MTDMPHPDNPRTGLSSVALLGSYLPRRCGIATFTHDLAEALVAADPSVNTRTVAMNDRPEGYRYDGRVGFEINQNRLAEYRLAADFLNMAHTDVLCVQHEFGIFGGEAGSHLYEMLRRLRMPVVATCHTVLKDPEPHYRRSAVTLFEHCDRLIVMAERAVEFLTDIYQVPRAKIALIPHGIPDVPFVDPNFYKDQFNVEGKKVILTFGLLGPSKGIENMIEALPGIVAKHPDVVYLVLGATHPGVLAHAGEDYRLGLQRQAKELGVADHIRWFDKFVTHEELTAFLGAADVYVTPYNNEAQITSGTLAYALGTGKATVATPYWHAQEMLADGRGSLVPFHDKQALTDAINHLFDKEVDRHAMRKAAYLHTRQMRWSQVADQYLDLFADVVKERHQQPKPLALRIHSPGQIPGQTRLSEIKLDHLAALTDSCGVMAHAKVTVPDRRSGYTTDTNANALVAVLFAQDHVAYTTGGELDRLAHKYLAFLFHAYDPDANRFRAHMSYAREWDAEPFSEDTHGRAVRALGETVARSLNDGHVTLAAELFRNALPACESFEHPHGMAYSLIGIHAYLKRFSGDSDARRIRESLAEKLFDRFKANHSDDWPWPNDEVTYTAARLPHALLLCGRWMFRDDMIQTALHSLQWLNRVQSGEHDRFAPVGSEGWYPRGGDKARFHQLPTEAAGAIDANLEAYRVTQDTSYQARARLCLDWFLGNNDVRLPLYDPNTGGCYDKLLPHGLDENQSAEATIAWLMSLLSLYEHEDPKAEPDAPPPLSNTAPPPAAEPVSTASADA
ncbi:MAG: glycosyltransferase family 4 protein [Planctomycetota bacterium]